MGPIGSGAWLGTAAARVSAGAAVGALIGLGCSLVTAPPRRRRRRAGRPLDPLDALVRRITCLVVLGLPAAVAVCWAGLAAAGVGPLVITVPLAVALLVLTALIYVSAVPGGELRPAWLFALTVGVVFALLAAVATPRYRIVGAAGLTVLVAAGMLGRRALHGFLDRRRQVRSLARLTVPLLVPDLPGYRLRWAHASAGRLVIELVAASTPAGIRAGSRPGIQILIGPVPPGFAPPATGPDVQPSPAITAGQGQAPWLPAGPGRWARRGGDVVQLAERRGSTLITASGRPEGGSLAPLAEALDSLRPSTPPDLAALSRAASAAAFPG